MTFDGFQKMTLLDFPGKIACTLFTHGCNFRCPFCHNPGLVVEAPTAQYTEEDILSFLKTRQGLLDGVCITGGEPTLQKDLPEFIRKVRALGFAVKLDTNGARPEVLEALLKEDLLDYVAMDIKSSPTRYGEAVGIPNFDLAPVKKSVALLEASGLPHEFRTTVVKELHDEQCIQDIGVWLKGDTKYFLQQFQNDKPLIGQNLTPHNPETLDLFRKILLPSLPNTELRGI